MPDVPEAAVQAALAAVPRWYQEHARESVQHYPSHGLVRAMIAAAAPLIRDAERERIRQMAIRNEAVCTGSEGTSCWFSDLLGGEAQERSDEKGAARPWPYDGPEGRARLTGNLGTEEPS